MSEVTVYSRDRNDDDARNYDIIRVLRDNYTQIHRTLLHQHAT